MLVLHVGQSAMLVMLLVMLVLHVGPSCWSFMLILHVGLWQILSHAGEAQADSDTNIRVMNELKAALRTQPIK